MVKKRRATSSKKRAVASGVRAKKAVRRAPRRRAALWLDYAPVQPRTFEQIAEASIEKNREVLRELTKY